MAKSSQKYTESTKESFQDDYEDFGYQVQNQKRYSSRKKQQSKFKDYDQYSDWEWYHNEMNTIPTQPVLEVAHRRFQRGLVGFIL